MVIRYWSDTRSHAFELIARGGVVALAGAATALFVWRMHSALGVALPTNLPAWRTGVLALLISGCLLDWLLFLGLLHARATSRPLQESLSAGAMALYPFLILALAYVPGVRGHQTLLEMLSVFTLGTVAGLHLKHWAEPIARSRSLRRALPALAVGSMAGYALTLSVASWLRHMALQSNALDLGMMDQVLWNIAHGNGFYTSYKGFSFLGEHFSPLLALLVPIYWLADGNAVAALVVAQSALVALTAGALYLVARHELRSAALATALAISFLLAPLLHEANLFDMHPDALAPPFMILAFYFLRRGRDRPFALALGLALLAKEDVALFAGALGIYAFVGLGRRRLGAGITLFSLLWLALVVQLIIPHFRGPGTSYGLWWRYNYLGQTPWQIVATAITQPALVAGRVFSLSRAKALATLLVPLAGLPLLGSSSLLLAVPSLAVNMLSQYEPQATLHMHYAFLVYPPLYLAAIVGLRRWLSGRPGEARQRQQLFWAGFLVVAALLSSYYLSPLGRWRKSELLTVDSRARVAQTFLSRIPAGVKLSAQSNLAAHLSERNLIRLFPDLEGTEFIALDTATYNRYPADDEYLQIVDALLQAGEFGVIWRDEGFVLLQRNAPTDYNETVRHKLYDFQDLFLYRRAAWGGKIVADPDASDGQALLARPGEHAEGVMSQGPYLRFPAPGPHRVDFVLKAEPADPEMTIAAIDVVSPRTGQVLASRELRGADFSDNRYKTFRLAFQNDPRQPLEFRVFFRGQTALWLDRITFE